MTEGLPLHYLLAPIAIAAAAVAAMIRFEGARTPRLLKSELGYKPQADAAVSMTLARYVGGHPAIEAPLGKPHVMLTHRHMAVFARSRGAKLFMIPWKSIEALTVLSRPQAEAASLAVRGLQTGAVEASEATASFLRVRYEDERGWWQNVLFELPPTEGIQQADEVRAFWERYKDEPDPEPEPGSEPAKQV